MPPSKSRLSTTAGRFGPLRAPPTFASSENKAAAVNMAHKNAFDSTAGAVA